MRVSGRSQPRVLTFYTLIHLWSTHDPYTYTIRSESDQIRTETSCLNRFDLSTLSVTSIPSSRRRTHYRCIRMCERGRFLTPLIDREETRPLHQSHLVSPGNLDVLYCYSLSGQTAVPVPSVLFFVSTSHSSMSGVLPSRV